VAFPPSSFLEGDCDVVQEDGVGGEEDSPGEGALLAVVVPQEAGELELST
jgi:hypothetical protein